MRTSSTLAEVFIPGLTLFIRSHTTTLILRIFKDSYWNTAKLPPLLLLIFVATLLVWCPTNVNAAEAKIKPKDNTYPCTPDELLQLHNKTRQDPKWLARKIRERYPNSDSSMQRWTKRAYQFLDSFNEKLTILKEHKVLAIPAEYHAHTMAHREQFAHQGCGGSSPADRIKKYADATDFMIVIRKQEVWFVSHMMMIDRG